MFFGTCRRSLHRRRLRLGLNVFLLRVNIRFPGQGSIWFLREKTFPLRTQCGWNHILRNTEAAEEALQG
jgi:hypothetical protein